MAVVTDVGAAVREALAARLKRDVAAIKDTDDLRNDLGLDSLDMIELLFKIEEVFDLEIPNEDLVKIATVGDVIGYVERRLAEKAAAPPKAAAAAKKPAGAGPASGALKPAMAAMRAAAPAAAAVPVATRRSAGSRPPASRRSAQRAPARARSAPKRAAAKKKGA